LESHNSNDVSIFMDKQPFSVLQLFKLILDVAMIGIFIVLVRFFNEERKAKISHLKEIQKKRLRTENFITWTFILFYIIRTAVMDIGYTLLVAIYLVKSN
jgi:hypothetical protein